MDKIDSESVARRARRRALRAAQVVTLGLALAGGGCYAEHGLESEAVRADAGGLEDSGGELDSGSTDASLDSGELVADAGRCDPDSDWREYSACCDAAGWDPAWGCLAWGPFVPPAEGELPAPRAAQRIA